MSSPPEGFFDDAREIGFFLGRCFAAADSASKLNDRINTAVCSSYQIVVPKHGVEQLPEETRFDGVTIRIVKRAGVI
ncbi:MAG: hypothetical protein Ct9H300mP16_14080 [Pseudomonadota bacterium]|nr:MAG: hypothetical protein Ct9H300mP16_14080 [Pseudomonadota bacterium]